MNDLRHGLVIEDDADLVEIFRLALSNAGYMTEICQSGSEALEMLKHVVPRTIVLDLHLPGVSGADVLKYIQSDIRFAKTRVIVATADPLLAETLRDETDIVLLKPVSYRQLLELAGRFL